MDIRFETEVNELADASSITSGQKETTNAQATTGVQKDKHPTYRFRMRHVFYIQLVIFIAIGLIAGLIIYLIENYSRLKTRDMEVSYINAWFISCTCICGCGLTTMNFAKLSKASQLFLLVLTVFFGTTMGTLPILLIKAFTHKHTEGMTVDNDHGKETENSEETDRSSSSSTANPSLAPDLVRKIALLPSPQQIRYWAYVTIIVSISVTCFTAYLCYFIILGAWLDVRYSKNELEEGNMTISPWYTSIIIVITGFNQNGLTPFSDGMVRFVNDVYMNIFVIMVFCLFRRLELKLV